MTTLGSQASAIPVGGTSTYFDTDALVEGSAPNVTNSSGFFDATVAAHHVRFNSPVDTTKSMSQR